MKRQSISLLAVLFAASLQASVFQIDSAPYFDGTEHVGPYHSRLDGIEVISFCIDLNSQVGFGQQFDVTVLSLANYEGADKAAYREEGFLAGQALRFSDLPTISAIQRAIWMVGLPGTTNPYLVTADAVSWLTLAENQTHNTTTDANVLLYLKDGVGQSQIGVVPEPATWAIIVIGAVSLFGFLRMGHNQRQNRK